MNERFLPGFSHRYWFQLCELAEVLDGCCEVELIFGAVWSSEAEAVEADDAFEVGEEHLDFLSSVDGGDRGIVLRDIPGFLANLVREVEAEPDITVHLGTTINGVDGFVGNFESVLSNGILPVTVNHGVAILATGCSGRLT